MKMFPRLFLCLVIAIGLSAISPLHAMATTAHHKHQVAHKKNHASADLRAAQKHLVNLGYYTGHADGVMGPKTKIALKNFQRDHKLRITGTLTAETRRALTNADKLKPLAAAPLLPTPTLGSMPAPTNYYDNHPDFYGHVNQQYADPLLLGRNSGVVPAMQGLPNRFAQVNVTEETSGTLKRYNIVVNGQPVLQADNQPSSIGVSRTYNLGSEDAIIFSTYNADDPICSYSHQLLVMRDGNYEMHSIDNCAHDYRAHVAKDSLFVTFSEADDREASDTWRYESGDLERL